MPIKTEGMDETVFQLPTSCKITVKKFGNNIAQQYCGVL
jgi:hypothetical protein